KTCKEECNEPGKQNRIMHKFPRIRSVAGFCHILFKEDEKQIGTKHQVKPSVVFTNVFVSVNVFRVVESILLIFGMKRVDMFRRRQCAEAIDQNRDSNDEPGQWSGEANVKMLNVGIYPVANSYDSTKSSYGKQRRNRDEIRQRGSDLVCNSREVMTKLMHGKDGEERD